MRANVDMTGGLIFSQRALLALIDKGMARQDAYKVVQETAMDAWRNGASFRQLLLANPLVAKTLSPDELEDLFDLSYHLQHANVAYDRLDI